MYEAGKGSSKGSASDPFMTKTNSSQEKGGTSAGRAQDQSLIPVHSIHDILGMHAN
ncbi:hypothetical protein KNP414_05053 [Paenibacillus mucilaginosus KNP414]|uniref:Uncharacterized protein n=1 Tax=Paenibacillus mucilaginosus (strain KNP414) TaxID=1036673 RepID=F8F6R1_PAEMK|nr:hypothetical protein KNP414_05053 [Paenibacillus mucilaginosus KNP414]